MQIPTWPRIQQRPAIVQREFRGVNKLDAFSIADVFASDMKNLTSSKYPALTIRPGYSVLGSAIGTKVLGLGTWKDTELHAVFNDGTWRKWNGSSWVTLASGLNTSAEWTFTNAKLNLSGICLIGSNGVDPIKVYDGSTVSNLSGAPSGGNYITQFADRLWCVVNGNELKASAYRMATDWTTVNGDDADSWYTIIETNDGQTINGIHAGLTKLTISKPNSIHELYGYSPSDYSVRVVTMDTGMVNNKSAVPLNGVLHFIGKSIMQYDGGMLPSKAFSSVVQYYLDSINSSGKTASCAGTDGQNLYVCIPVDSSTPDTILVYDSRREAQCWNVWKDIQALHFARMGNDLYIGDALGRVLKLGGTTDNGTPISSYWVTKPFTGPSMSQVIRWIRMYETLDLPTGSSFSTYISKSVSGDADWQLAGTITASSDIQRKSIYIPTTVAQNAQQIRAKFVATGPFTLYEWAREQDALPAR